MQTSTITSPSLTNPNHRPEGSPMALDELLSALQTAQNQTWQSDETTNSEYLTTEEVHSQRYTAQKSSTVHFLMGETGGMGKSVAASWLAQSLYGRGHALTVVDADPNNDSLSRFKALSAERFRILNDDDEFDVQAMDMFVDRMMESPNDFIIDCGASGFIALASYLKRESVIDFIAESGKNVCVHTFVVGGDRQDKTIELAKAFLDQMPTEVQLVLWINPKFGKPRHEEQFSAYFANRGVYIVRIPDVHAGSAGKNVDYMLENKLTFDEAINSAELSGLSKQRLSSFWRKLSASIDAAVECGA